MPSLATKMSVIDRLRRISLPEPTDSVISPVGATALAVWAEAWVGTPAARPAASAAARAGPSVARLKALSFFILSCSHRNTRNIVAARDIDRRPGIGGLALARRRSGHAAALETRDVAAHRIGR